MIHRIVWNGGYRSIGICVAHWRCVGCDERGRIETATGAEATAAFDAAAAAHNTPDLLDDTAVTR